MKRKLLTLICLVFFINDYCFAQMITFSNTGIHTSVVTLKATQDGGFLMITSENSFPGDGLAYAGYISSTISAIRLTSLGEVLWKSTISVGGSLGIVENNDGSFTLVGSGPGVTECEGIGVWIGGSSGFSTLGITRISASGEVLSLTTLNDQCELDPKGGVQLSGDTLLIIGMKGVPASYNVLPDLWLYRTDKSGSLLGTLNLGQSNAKGAYLFKVEEDDIRMVLYDTAKIYVRSITKNFTTNWTKTYTFTSSETLSKTWNAQACMFDNGDYGFLCRTTSVGGVIYPAQWLSLDSSLNLINKVDVGVSYGTPMYVNSDNQIKFAIGDPKVDVTGDLNVYTMSNEGLIVDSMLIYIEGGQSPTAIVSTMAGDSFAIAGNYQDPPTNSGPNDAFLLRSQDIVTTVPDSFPQYLFPMFGQTDVKTILPADWSQVIGNLGYRMLLDTVPTFDGQSCDTFFTNTGVSNFTVSNLKFGTQYFWRVDVLLENQGYQINPTYSTFTTQAAPILVTPIDGEVINGLFTNLIWQVNKPCTYTLQFDTTSNFNSPLLVTKMVFADMFQYMNTWSGTSTLLIDTKYYWRVRMQRLQDTSLWSEIRCFKTTNGSAALLSPSNGAQVNTLLPQLSCVQMPGGNGFVYQLDTTADFNSNNLITWSGSQNTQLNEPLQMYKTYYWRAKAMIGQDTFDWTPTWSFQTAIQTQLLSPANGSSNVSVVPILKSNNYLGASQYLYAIDTLQAFDSDLFQLVSYTSFSAISPYLQYGCTYYVKVAVVFGADTSNWSTVYTFSTNDSLTLISPQNGAVNLNIPSLKWNVTGLTHASSSPHATVYQIQTDTLPTFDSPFSNISYSGTQTLVSSSGFASPGKKYYWRGRMISPVDTSVWSAYHEFTVKNYETALLQPLDSAISNSNSVFLVWTNVGVSNGYQYQIDTTESFNSPMLINGTTNSGQNTKNITGLQMNRKYFWRVKTLLNGYTINWSSIRQFNTFSTTNLALSAATLIAPANGASINNTSATLTWNPVFLADSYQVQLDTSQFFDSPVLINDTINGSQNTKEVAGLQLFTKYYWRVKTLIGTYSIPWSVVRHFETIYLLDSPLLLNPENDTLVYLNSDVHFTWSSVLDATQYQFQILNASPFTVVDTFVSVVANELGVHQWRLQSENDTATSNWSVFRTYKVIDTIPQLVAPYNYSVLNLYDVAFNWKQMPNNTGYLFQLDHVSSFDSPALYAIDIAEDQTNFLVEGVNDNETYFWRVAALFGSDTSDWSELYTFQTAPGLLPPVIIGPANLTQFPYGTGFSLSWEPSIGADYYTISLDTTPDLSQSSFSSTDTEWVANNLVSGATYYWQVMANSGNLNSEWSETMSFSIERCTEYAFVEATACDSFEFYDHTLYQTGLYFDTLIGQNCDTIRSINISILNLEPIVMQQADNLLMAYPEGQNGYQWLDCNTQEPIATETLNQLTVTGNGSVAVVIFDGVCMDTSACFDYFTNGIESTHAINELLVLPNPTKHQVSIAGLLSSQAPYVIQISDMLGRVVWTETALQLPYLVQLPSLNSACYLVQVKDHNGVLHVVPLLIHD